MLPYHPPLAQDTGSPQIAWRPTPAYTERSRLRRFMADQGIGTLAELLARSVNEPGWFWDAVVRDLKLEWFAPYTEVLDVAQGIAWPRWWVGGRYNYVHDAVDTQAVGPHADKPALISEGEGGAARTLTYRQLAAEVNRAANALKALGVGPGDRVGIFLPMILEAAVALLAVSKIGAIYTPVFSGYGSSALAGRLQACGARLLITADGFSRGGKPVLMKETADAAVVLVPSVEHQLVVQHKQDIHGYVPWQEGRDHWWHEALAAQSTECPTEETSAEDPYMIIYTSGTTGPPKGVVHVHGGFPIKAAQELAHCFDLHTGERLLWLSDLGWMMGPWSITGALLLGATCVLVDGAIAYPQPDRLWALVARHHITHLGIAPTSIRQLMSMGDAWVQRHDLSSLVVLTGAGEPWTPAPWQWYFDVVGGGTRPLINYSGGTEVAGGILASNTLLPIKPCAFSAPVPGMAADVVDAAGAPVRETVGELALRAPCPGTTRGFWNDPDGYLAAYWARVPGLWMHGDWARVDADGFWTLLGRADDTIKVAGKRIGPAEIEAAAGDHAAVQEAAAIGAPDALKGEVVVLFVRPRPGIDPDETLRQEVSALIAARLGKALRPQIILFVTDLPRTRNGKIMRRLVRQRYLGLPLGDLAALDGPAGLEAIPVRDPV